jgi:hypothetical protein
MKQVFNFFILLILSFTGFSQSTGVGIGTTNPHASAALEVRDTARGFLPPRMTYTQRNTINNPAAGLIIWCTDCDTSGQVQVFNGKTWTNLLGGLSAIPIVTPTVSTTVVSSITSNSAVSGGNISSDGNSPIISRGVCWDTFPNPTVNNQKTLDGSGAGNFSSNLTGLQPGKTYYVRAYAANIKGLAYGNQTSFTTSTIDLTTGLVAYYPFNGNANDESGNGNNLITNGSITYSNNHIGTSNSACYFSNGNNYFTTPNSSWTLINNLPKGTVSFWIKIDSQYTSNHYFGIGNSFMIKEEWGVGEDLFFGMQDGSTKVRMQITGVFPGSQSTDVFGNTSLAINTWNHIVGVWDGSYHTLYINGIRDGRISNPNGIPNRPNPAYFSIGTSYFGGNGSTSQPSGTYGSMSNLRFYNRALNQSEITYLATH